MAKTRRRKTAKKARQPHVHTGTAASADRTPPVSRVDSPAEDIRVFLSYSRTDDQSFGMVRPFKDLLRTLVHAKSGRKISTFLDQDDIKWGDIWKQRLDAEILRSTVFIPFLSSNYLESSMCRLEYNKFQAAATARGVPELILPVLLIEAPLVFNDSSSDDLVRAAVERQYEVIEDAVLSERGSSQWKRTMARLADRFTVAYQAAESALANVNPDDTIASPPGESDDDHDEPGLTELFELFEDDLKHMTSLTEEIGAAIVALGEATGSIAPLPKNPNTSDIQKWSFRAAEALAEPSQILSDRGEELLTTTQRLDNTVAGFRRIVAEVPDYEKPFTEMLSGLSGLDEVQTQLQDLLTSIKPAESISVPLRRAIRPASRGLTRVTDAISIIHTWK